MTEPPATSPAPRRGHLLAAAIIMTLLVTDGSFVPMQFKPLSWSKAVADFKNVPYLELGVYRRADYVANLLLFVPLGFLWIGAIDLDRRRRSAALLATPIILALLAALAVAIEFFQQWSVRRTVSQNDMIAESAGAAIGVALWFFLGRWLTGKVRDLTAPKADASPLRRLLQLYLLGFLAYAAQPLDITFSREEISRKFQDTVTPRLGEPYSGRILQQTADTVRIEVRRDDKTYPVSLHRDQILSVETRRILLRPFAHGYGGLFRALWQVGTDVILFIPIGMLLRLGRGRPRSMMHAAMLGVLVACAIETMQLFIFSRYVDTTDVITSGLGGLIGALIIGPLHLNRPRTALAAHERQGHLGTSILICLAYCVPLALVLWAPYHRVPDVARFITNLAQAIDVPFKAYYYTSEFKALSSLLRGLMLFVPIGAVLRWGWGDDANARAGGRVLVVMIALAVGVLIETGQAATVVVEISPGQWLGQKADITDLLIYVVGALSGWWLWGKVTANREGS